MNEIRRKIQQFDIEIRRSDRQSIISRIRKDFINVQAIEDSIQIFLQKKQQEISIVCWQGINSISKQLLERLVGSLDSSSIVFFQKYRNQSTWYIDCLSKNNLKLMSELSQHKWDHFYKNFFEATIIAHQKYKEFSYSFQLVVQDSKCYIEPHKPTLESSSPELSLHSILHQDYNEDKFLSILQFWAIYIETQTSFEPNDFIVMIKTFFLWFWHTEIHQHEETYSFILQVFKLIGQSSILTQKGKPSQLRAVFELFYTQIKKYIPFALAKMNFNQIGQILIELVKQNQNLKQTFSDLLFRPDTIVTYLKNIFKLSLERCNIASLKVGIRIIYYLLGKSQLLHFHDKNVKKQIFEKFINQYLFHPELQYLVTFTLSSIADLDNSGEMREIFEHIDYEKLTESTDPQSEQTIYRFLISVLSAFPQNTCLSNKILIKCDLVNRLRIFCEKSITQNLQDNKDEWFISLIHVVDSNLIFFIDNYTNHVNAVYDYAKTLSFQGKQVFLQAVQKFTNLKIKQILL